MTQAEFNQMLQTAIAQGAVGGYYTSKYSGEEIDQRLGGSSIYDYAVEGGYTGTEAEFQALMASGPWIPASRMGAPSGVAALDAYGRVPYAQMPSASGPVSYRAHMSAGWYRIYSGVSVTALIHLGNVYGAYGPSGIVMLVNFDRYAPRINILMAGFYGNNILFDKVRLTRASSGSNLFLEVHYNKTANTAFSYGIPFYHIGAGNEAFASDTFLPVPDTPEVSVIPETAISSIPSGALVTSAQLTAAVERGLSL